MGDALLWDDVPMEAEEISEEDIKNAENQGKKPPMLFIGTCEESTPKEQNWADFTGYQANLKWHIDEILECPVGTPAPEEIKDRFEGKYQWDKIPLPHPREEDWMKNKRVLVAHRCGLIPTAKSKIPKNAWSDLIIGAQVKIETVESTSKKDGKKYVNIAFDGYQAVTESTNVDSFDDI